MTRATKIVNLPFLLFSAGLLLLIAPANAAKLSAEGRGTTAEPIAELPLKLLLRRVPVAQVAIGDSKALAFILDTGANDDVLNARIVRELGLPVINPQV